VQILIDTCHLRINHMQLGKSAVKRDVGGVRRFRALGQE
jgi:hypothetical protein